MQKFKNEMYQAGCLYSLINTSLHVWNDINTRHTNAKLGHEDFMFIIETDIDYFTILTQYGVFQTYNWESYVSHEKLFKRML